MQCISSGLYRFSRWAVIPKKGLRPQKLLCIQSWKRGFATICQIEKTVEIAVQYKFHFDGSVTPLELETKDGVDIRINGAVQETWTFLQVPTVSPWPHCHFWVQGHMIVTLDASFQFQDFPTPEDPWTHHRMTTFINRTVTTPSNHYRPAYPQPTRPDIRDDYERRF